MNQEPTKERCLHHALQAAGKANSMAGKFKCDGCDKVISHEDQNEHKSESKEYTLCEDCAGNYDECHNCGDLTNNKDDVGNFWCSDACMHIAKYEYYGDDE